MPRLIKDVIDEHLNDHIVPKVQEYAKAWFLIMFHLYSIRNIIDLYIPAIRRAGIAGFLK